MNRLTIVRLFGGGKAAELAAEQYFQDIGKPEMKRNPATASDQPKSR
ncbi:MAG TPA: hypothetical protein VHY22_18345 [Chthoniobacteraceae bacterium]|jgi:hypothetical protein|nr:hypothetical protein [Chthoniobacteraceae bacterium]